MSDRSATQGGREGGRCAARAAQYGGMVALTLMQALVGQLIKRQCSAFKVAILRDQANRRSCSSLVFRFSILTARRFPSFLLLRCDSTRIGAIQYFPA